MDSSTSDKVFAALETFRIELPSWGFANTGTRFGRNYWLESGRLLGKIHADKGFGPEKLRDLHFDLLIALTARSVGARLVTSNREDFELIGSYHKVLLEIW